MEALNASSRLSHAFLHAEGDMTEERSTTREEDMVGFKNFPQSQLTEVHARCLRILEILGFLPGKPSSYVFTNSGGCEKYSCIGHKDDPESARSVDGETLRLDRDKNDLSHSLVVEREGKPQPVLGRYFTSAQTQREDFDFLSPRANRLKIYMGDYSSSHCSSVNYSDWARSGSSADFRDRFDAWKDTLQQDVRYTAKLAAHFASNLAWTDRDETVRLMNVSMISSTYGALVSEASRDSKFEGNIAHAIGLCTDGLGFRYLEEKLWPRGWIALDVDGLVVIRNAAQSGTIHLRGVFLSFKRGQISYGGTPCYKICADVETNGPDNSMFLEVQPHRISPSNYVKTLSLRAMSYNDKGIIWVRHEVFHDQNLLGIANPDRIAWRIPRAWVSQPCEHPYSRCLDLKTTSVVLRGVLQGFFMGVVETHGAIIHKTNGIDVIYQQTDGNNLGQWLALQWRTGSNPDGYIILQQDCCMACILKRLEALTNKLERVHDGEGFKVCIIAARPAEETVDLQRRLP